MEREDELDELRRRAADHLAEAEATYPERERAGVQAGDVVDGVATAIVGMEAITDLIGAIPSIAGESMDVIGNIGDASGDVLDFDF
jgi:hypothetical protein